MPTVSSTIMSVYKKNNSNVIKPSNNMKKKRNLTMKINTCVFV